MMSDKKIMTLQIINTTNDDPLPNPLYGYYQEVFYVTFFYTNTKYTYISNDNKLKQYIAVYTSIYSGWDRQSSVQGNVCFCLV